MFSDNGPLVGHNFPTTLGIEIGLRNHRVQFNLSTVQAGCFRVGMGSASRVEVPIERIVQASEHAFSVGNRRNFANLRRRENLRFQPHVAVFGPFRLEHIHPLGSVRQSNAADMMEAARHSG